MKKLGNILISLMILFSACNDPNEGKNWLELDSFPVYGYLSAPENAEQFSLWAELLEYTDLSYTLNLDANYTCFVPENEAMTNYLREKGVSSVEELNKEEAINLVKYHTIVSEDRVYETAYFSDGILPDSTASGDYLSIEFGEGGIINTTINEEALIKKLNITVTNGVIHSLDKVLTPVTGNIIDKLDNNYSIMLAAIKATGYDELLSQQYVNSLKVRYTLLAVSDKVYQEYNIHDVAALATYLGATDNKYENTDNILNKYVAYHILGSSYSFTDLFEDVDRETSKNINTLATNEMINVSFEEESNAFYINYDDEEESGVEILLKNINCKNGVIHTVSDLMEMKTPPPARVQFDVADYPEMASVLGGYFQQENRTSDIKLSFGSGMVLNCYTTLKGNVSSLGYFVPGQNSTEAYKAKNKDYLILNLNSYGWVEMDTPTIVVGKYKVLVSYLRLGIGSDEIDPRGKIKIIISGEEVGGEFATNSGIDDKYIKDQEVGEIELEETGSYKLRIMASDNYQSYIDYIEFQPIND